MIYPMFALVLLTYAVSFYMIKLRFAAVKGGHVSLSYFKLYQGDIPVELQQISRNYSNLFEMPTLFYAAGAAAIGLHIETTAMLILSWLFVVGRALHSWIHITSNRVIPRMRMFVFSTFCVLGLWILLVWNYSTPVS